MKPSDIQINRNDETVILYWDLSETAYKNFNLYTSLTLNMDAGESLAQTLANAADPYYSNKHVTCRIARSLLGVTVQEGVYLRVKGVLPDGSVDIENPSDIKFLPPAQQSGNAAPHKEYIFYSGGLPTSYSYGEGRDCGRYDQAIINVSYTQGDETSFEFKFQFSSDNRTWFDATYETLGTPVTLAAKEYRMVGSANQRIIVPLTDAYIRPALKATGGTPTGFVAMNLVLGQATTGFRHG